MEHIVAMVQERARDGKLTCVEAFRVAEELGVPPQSVGEAADTLGVRLTHCQLGLFGYGERKRLIEPAGEVSAELEWAIRTGLVDGRLPCKVAWEIAARLDLPKLHVANAAEALGVRIGPCQLGAF